MRCRWRIPVRGVQDSLLQAASAARSFAIAFGVVCEKLFAGTSTNCDKAFWFVIIARHEAATASYGALEDEWLRLARRASILL